MAMKKEEKPSSSKSEKKPVVIVNGQSARERTQANWDLMVIGLGTVCGAVCGGATCGLVASGMATAGGIAGVVLYVATILAAKPLLDKFDALRDKSYVIRMDDWFFIGLSMLGTPIDAGLGLWLGSTMK